MPGVEGTPCNTEWLHCGRRGLTPVRPGAEPRDADESRLSVAKDVAEKSATLLKNSTALCRLPSDFTDGGAS